MQKRQAEENSNFSNENKNPNPQEFLVILERL